MAVTAYSLCEEGHLVSTKPSGEVTISLLCPHRTQQRTQYPTTLHMQRRNMSHFSVRFGPRR